MIIINVCYHEFPSPHKTEKLVTMLWLRQKGEASLFSNKERKVLFINVSSDWKDLFLKVIQLNFVHIGWSYALHTHTYSTMSVCLKINTNIKLLGLVVQVFHSCFDTVHRYLQPKDTQRMWTVLLQVLLRRGRELQAKWLALSTKLGRLLQTSLCLAAAASPRARIAHYFCSPD